MPSHLDSNSHPLYTTSLIFKSVCEWNKWPASARPASTAGKSLRRTVARFLFFRFTGPLSAFPPGAPARTLLLRGTPSNAVWTSPASVFGQLLPFPNSSGCLSVVGVVPPLVTGLHQNAPPESSGDPQNKCDRGSDTVQCWTWLPPVPCALSSPFPSASPSGVFWGRVA